MARKVTDKREWRKAATDVDKGLSQLGETVTIKINNNISLQVECNYGI